MYIVYVLEQINVNWQHPIDDLQAKLNELSLALRTQTLYYLLRQNKERMESYAEDDWWTPEAEAGAPAKNLGELLRLIQRPKRWASEITLQRIAAVQKIEI